ncbi:unnamed protein product [Clonostachys rosea f. rosea IK726]|uniref:Uncharacterized protein n=1 Tax=Clonostachys rosea f. rosea IK726 TaxID=1349383 RepID=A0ACA9UJJ9_BIOOC|nr:unnamed protein product [Clonostachys rosea f. rosea IK726]
MSDINVTPEIQNARMPPNLSREERMAFMANHVEAIQKLNPEADMKLDTNWWKASVNLSSDIDEFLDAETKKKVNETTMKMFQPGAGLDTAKAVREELKDLLVGHENIYKSLEASLFADENSLQQAQELLKDKIATGELAFPGVAEQKSLGSQ